MIKFLKNVLKPYSKVIVLVMLFQLGQAGLTLILPRINSDIIDIGIINGDIPFILRRGAVMVILTVLQFVCAVLGSIQGSKVALGSGRDLRQKVYEKIINLSQREVGEIGAPALITRATNDIQQVVQFITFLFTSIVSAPIMFFGGLVIALTHNIELSGVLLVTIPLLVIISVVFVIKILPAYSKQQIKIDELNGIVRDQISGSRVVRAFNRENYEEVKMTDVARDLSDINTSIGCKTALLQPTFTVIVNISSIVLLWIGGVGAEKGDFLIGDVIAFITYVSMILTATLMASMVFVMLPRADVSAKRIQEVFDTECCIKEKSETVDPAEKDKELVFNNVSFSYEPGNPEVEPVLKNISFTAKCGHTTAIIGPTGAGKSTIISMIPRLMDPTEGTITYGGIDLKDMRLDKINSLTGLVPQKAYLFSGTLESNLRSGKADATDEELWEALEIAQAKEFVMEKQDNLKMTVSEGGTNYSGGQRQRLSIARALVKKPEIYLFDDSFSALDYATDYKLRSALAPITKDSIVIIVGQRISSIRNADQIIVLNNGVIEDIGKHDELIARCSLYQEIADSQLKKEEA